MTDPALLVRFGKVIAVDHASATARVAIGDIETQPLPWAMGRCGKTRVWSPPSVGEQVVIIAPDGDMEGAIIFGSIAQNDFPQAGDSRREVIAFDDGAELAYDPVAHALDLCLPDGATINIEASGGVTIDAIGGLKITGDVEIDGELVASGDVVGSGISLSSHTHGGVESGASSTGAPQ